MSRVNIGVRVAEQLTMQRNTEKAITATNTRTQFEQDDIPPEWGSGTWAPGVVGPQEVGDRRAEAGDGGGDRAEEKAGG